MSEFKAIGTPPMKPEDAHEYAGKLKGHTLSELHEAADSFAEFFEKQEKRPTRSAPKHESDVAAMARMVRERFGMSLAEAEPAETQADEASDEEGLDEPTGPETTEERNGRAMRAELDRILGRATATI